MTPTAETDLKQRWADLKLANPGVRIREAAAALNVSEMELLATDCGEGVTRLRPECPAILQELHAVDLADLIFGLSDEQAVLLVAALPVEQTAAAFDAMDHERRVHLFEKLERSFAARVADGMSADERADLFKSLPDEVRADLLARMPKDASSDIRELIRYPENSAGGLMTTDYIAIDNSLTVERAIEQVRETAAEMETIYEAYAVDPHGTLLGVVSLRDLVLARAELPPALDSRAMRHLIDLMRSP